MVDTDKVVIIASPLSFYDIAVSNESTVVNLVIFGIVLSISIASSAAVMSSFKKEKLKC